MSDIRELSDNIQSSMSLGRQESTGWYSCVCPVCKNDRKTGGFLFEDDKIIYKCFRASCDSDCGITEGEYVSRKFRSLMETVGVQVPIKLLTAGTGKIAEVFKDTELFVKHEPDRIKMREGLCLLSKSKHDNAELWREYFESRFVDISNIYMIESGKYHGNTIIAMKQNGGLVGYTIVTPDGYIKDYQGNSNLLYLPDGRVYDTMFVVEGVLDAKSIPSGCAVGSDRITPEQAYHLRNCNRVIMIPDRSGNRFIKQFHSYGWEISIPKWNVKDVNEAVVKLGLIETVKRILDGSTDSLSEAQIKYELWLER